MIHRTSRIALTVLLAASLVATVACNLSSAVKNLQFVIAAAEVVLPVVLAGSTVPLSADTKAQIIAYLTAVGDATDASAAILTDTTKTNAQKAAAIASAFSGAIAPNLPPGTPANIVAMVHAVSDAIAKFLTSVAAKGPPSTVAMAEAQVPAKVSRADKQALGEIGQRARVLRSTLPRSR